MKIALLSPRGPLYRHKTGIFKKSLRYMPLTLPTLAALIPPELAHQVRLIDEGIEHISVHSLIDHHSILPARRCAFLIELAQQSPTAGGGVNRHVWPHCVP